MSIEQKLNMLDPQDLETRRNSAGMRLKLYLFTFECQRLAYKQADLAGFSLLLSEEAAKVEQFANDLSLQAKTEESKIVPGAQVMSI